MNRGRLPARVTNTDWQEWLETFPLLSEAGYTATVRFHKASMDHLRRMPSPAQLQPDEWRNVREDLRQYQIDLIQAQQPAVELGLADVGVAAVGVGLAIFVPGAQVPGTMLVFGVLVLRAGDRRLARQRQRLIEEVGEKYRMLTVRLGQ